MDKKTIKQYVREMLEKQNLKETINLEAEMWNILYCILEELGLKQSDFYDKNNLELVAILEGYEQMYFNHFPNKS